MLVCRNIRAVALVLACLGLLVALIRPASACTCRRSSLSRELVPSDGAEVPTNGVVRVFLEGGWPAALVADVPAEYRLRGPDGALVAIRADVEGTMITLDPVRLLAPNSPHVLERLYAYGHGDLLTDQERWTNAGAPGDRPVEANVVRVWFPELTFRTGAGPSDRVPPAPRVSDARYSVAGRGSSCGPGETVSAQLELPPGLVTGDTLGLEVEGSGVLWRRPYAAAAEGGLRAGVSDGYCADDPVHVDVSTPPRVRALAWSATGRASRRSAWVRVEPGWSDGREPEVPRPHVAALAEREAEALPAAARFHAPPIVDAAPLPGPAACPDGLARASDPLLLSGDRWNRTEYRQLVRAGGRLWVLSLGEAGETVLARELDAAGTAGPGLRLGGRRDTFVAVDAEGDLPFVGAAQQPSGALRLWRPRADGSVAWERTLEERARGWSLMGGGRYVFVEWERTREASGRRESWPAWVILDAVTGKDVARGDLGTHGPATRVRLLGWDGSHFALAWEWRAERARASGGVGVAPAGEQGTWLALVATDGTVARVFHLNREGVPEAAFHGPGGWILSVRPEIAWLDDQGRMIAGPWTIPTALLSGVSDIATLGDLAVLTGPSPGGGSSVVLLDRSGALSPPHSLGGGRGKDPAIEAVGDSLVVAYGLGRSEAIGVETLVCSVDSPVGPPARIAR